MMQGIHYFQLSILFLHMEHYIQNNIDTVMIIL